MPSYAAPLRDYEFCLYELLDFESHRALPGFEEFSPDVVKPVLEQAAKFTSDVLYPLNRVGDEEGCTLNGGKVTTPKGFKEAYRLLCEGGWPSLTCDPQDGGAGMPHMVNFLFEEMMCAASLSFGLFPGLTRGAYVAVRQFGSHAQRALYAPKLASGEWAGSMCLTEAHAGTDLGLLKTQAVPKADGAYAITGTKIFISAGEHDFTPNIIYLVLARLPDAPKGTKGISLFLVPKVLVNADGSLGARNAVSCGALEEKMGIHGCPTCVMNFDGAIGWLVGEPHQGLKAMFAMMNAERIAVGIQGLAIAEASYQNAVAYARERLQGRAPGAARDAAGPADPILVHPDVRRMLLTQRALIESCRMLALATAQWLDRADHGTTADARAEAEARMALLTPIVKAFLTDCGSEAANLGMQVLGGHGFIRANGQEQYVRDARITQIYEGTNGVQAMDLLGRKILADGGVTLKAVLQPLEADALTKSVDPRLAEFAKPALAALNLLQSVTARIIERAKTDPAATGAAAVPYLKLLALTLCAGHWLRAVEMSLPRGNEEFYRAKIATARFFMTSILPQTQALAEVIAAGSAPVMDFEDAAF
ncbi:acyl-CoA dehydrogenase C-terminal domain-containing protein [Aestuariivirga sp.]|uniref:acyl-CoA dehydrogenase C-terminal domain-containing protein n=1 Tax=Aestuariivirga sp. TaxID=2650926 RepID=UPI0039E3C4F4